MTPMMLAALATSGSSSSQILGSYKAPQISADNMFMLSLMSRHNTVQKEQSERASLFDAPGVPDFVEGLPENQSMTGNACTASIPSEAERLPSVDVSQLYGGID